MIGPHTRRTSVGPSLLLSTAALVLAAVAPSATAVTARAPFRRLVSGPHEARGRFWTAPRPAYAMQPDTTAALSFTDITAAGGLGDPTRGSHGAMFGDADGDGLADLYVTYNYVVTGEAARRANRFFRNTGGGTFIEEAAARGIANLSEGTHGAAWVDLDNDGDFDLLNGMTYADFGPVVYTPRANRIFQNTGGVFADVTPPAMAAYADFTRAFFASDFDRDGDLDVFGINGDKGSSEDPPDANEAYRNEGGGGFTAIAAGAFASAPAGQGATDTDFDGDGDVDIIAGNRGGDLCILRNTGAGSFTLVPPATVGITHRASTGITAGDLDNDGDFDLLLMDQDVRNTYWRIVHAYRNVGGGQFSYLASLPLVGGYTAGMADLDNDGDLDLVFPGFSHAIINHGGWNFTVGPPVPGPAIGSTDPRSLALADIDGDGDLDFAITAKFGGLALVRNNFDAGNWLKVKLTSAQGQIGAPGAKVRLLAPGTGQIVGLREAKSNTGYIAQDDPVLHFGLGAATTVTVQVTFADGTTVTRTDVTANQTLAIGGSGVPSPVPGSPQNLTSAVVDQSVTLNWSAPLTGNPPTNYIVQAGSLAGAANLASVSTGGTAPSFSAVAPPGTYYVRVRGQNAAGTGPPSNEVIVVTAVCQSAPQAPSGLASNVSGQQVTLTWTVPSAGSRPRTFILEVGSTPSTANLAVFDLGGTAPGFAATAPPGTYFVRVRAQNPCGTSAPSNEVAVRVPGSGG